MTNGQARVLALLGVLLGLQAIINPNVRAILTGKLNPLTGQQSNGGGGALGLPGTVIAGYIGVGAAAVALVALAAPAPKLATWIVVIFIALALIEHSGAWSGALASAQAGITALTGSSASSGAAGPPASDPANRKA